MDDEREELQEVQEQEDVREDLATDEQAEGMDDRIFNKLSELYDTIDKWKVDVDDRFDRISKIMIDSGAVVRQYEEPEEPRPEYKTIEDLDFTI